MSGDTAACPSLSDHVIAAAYRTACLSVGLPEDCPIDIFVKHHRNAGKMVGAGEAMLAARRDNTESPCSECQGRGWRGDYEYRCDRCDGTGRENTDGVS